MKRYEYITGDPIVPIRITNPNNNRHIDTYAYLDMGAIITGIPRDMYDRLGFECDIYDVFDTPSGYTRLWVSKARISFNEDIFEIWVTRSDSVDPFIGRDILDRFVVCFNGRENIVTIE
ncbi:MAG: hypothetical protein ACE5KT_11680 [Methanosarcinales archaeon]